MIEVKELSQKFGERQILKSISLRVEVGEIFGLIGPTGAGKTTLLRIIGLLDRPSSGTVYFKGQDVTISFRSRLEARRKMAFVLQKPAMLSGSVYENIGYGLKWRANRHDVNKRIGEVLELVGLPGFEGRVAKTLSGGEAQRVAIARAIAGEPELLLLDEPTANLDPGSEARVEEIILRIISETRTTIIFSTHDRFQAQRLASRIGVLIGGELIQTGDPREIFYHPRSYQVAQFVGVDNILEGKIVAKDGELASIEVDGNMLEAISSSPIGETVSIFFRAEDVAISLLPLRTSMRNIFKGKITKVTTVGSFCHVLIDCGFPLMSLITAHSAEEMALETGKEVYALVKATSIHAVTKNSS